MDKKYTLLKSMPAEEEDGEYRYYVNGDKSIIVSIFVPNDFDSYEWDSFYVNYYCPETLGEIRELLGL